MKRPSQEESLISILGGAAAGVARNWSESDSSSQGSIADSHLESVLAHRAERSVQPCASDSTIPVGATQQVWLVQFSTPDEQGFLELLSAAGFKR